MGMGIIAATMFDDVAPPTLFKTCLCNNYYCSIEKDIIGYLLTESTHVCTSSVYFKLRKNGLAGLVFSYLPPKPAFEV